MNPPQVAYFLSGVLAYFPSGARRTDRQRLRVRAGFPVRLVDFASLSRCEPDCLLHEGNCLFERTNPSLHT